MDVRAAFARGNVWFTTSPLYGELARSVADDDALLDLAGACRPGQQPANMLFGAVHQLVLRDPSAELAQWYGSVVGEDALEPAGAAPVFAAFCREHEAELRGILGTRLVQTSVPGRGAAVRYALHEVGRRVDGPVDLVEVGAGAGLQLRFDRWAVETAGRRFGPADAPVTLTPEWRSDDPVPDLDALPPIGLRLGIDLEPVDVTDPAEREWQRALIWPEHTERFAQLTTALDVVAADPPEVLMGDAVELLPRIDAERLTDRPVVVWHSMVRIHVPEDRRAAFDAAIAALGRSRRLFHASLEADPRVDDAALLQVREETASLPAGRRRSRSDNEPHRRPAISRAHVEGHGRFIRPLA